MPTAWTRSATAAARADLRYSTPRSCSGVVRMPSESRKEKSVVQTANGRIDALRHAMRESAMPAQINIRAQSGAMRQPVVEIDAGKIAGACDDAVYSFKGIPYAASTA